MYLGDFSSTATISAPWGTYDSSGASVAASSSGTVTVFEATSTAAAVLGVTDNRSYRGITGMNQVFIDLTATGFYAPGKDYVIMLSSAIVDGQIVSGAIGTFSVRNRSVRPGSSGAVSANISATSQTFDAIGNRASVTSVSTVGSVGSVTGAVGSVGGRLLPLNSSAQVIDSTGAVAVAAVTGAVGSVAGNVGGNVVGSVGSVAGNVDGNIAGSVGSVAGNVSGSVGSVAGRILPANSSLGVISTDGVYSAQSTQAFPPNFAVLAISTTGYVTAGTVIDKTGYTANLQSTTQTFDVVGNRTGNVTGSVGTVNGRSLPLNSSLTAISTNGIVNADTRFIAGSSTAIDQIRTNLDATIASRSTLGSTQVKDQVVAALNTDTYGAGTGAPPATTTLAGKITRLYDTMRGRLAVNSSEKVMFSAGSTAEQWRKVLTDNGTTYTEAEAST